MAGPRHPRGAAALHGRRLPAQRPAVRGGHRSAGAGRGHRRRRFRQDHVDGGPRRLAGRHRPGPTRGGPRPDLHLEGGLRARHPRPRDADRRRDPAGARTSRCRRRGRARGARADRVDLPLLRGRPARRPRSAHRARAGHQGRRGRLALPARGAGGGAALRSGHAALRPPRDRDRLDAHARRRDERAPRGPRGRRPGAGALGTAGRRARRVRDPQDLRRGRPQVRREARRARRAPRAGAGVPRPQARPRPHGVLRPDRARGPSRHRVPGGGGDRAGPVQGRAARRVPGHLGGPGAAAVAAVLRPRARSRSARGARARSDGGRRPQPGHLRLARSLGVEHHPLR